MGNGLIDSAACPNRDCPDFGVRGGENIGIRGSYGRRKDRMLLYCRTCGKRFAPTRATAFFGLHVSREKISAVVRAASEGLSVRAIGRRVGLDKDTVARIITRAAGHCRAVLRRLLSSLYLGEDQAAVLWSFLRWRGRLERKKGSGEQQGSEGD